MKRKHSVSVPKKLEKKDTRLFILDLYIQREESFYIVSLKNRFEFHQIYNNNDKIIIPVFYPRIKNTSFYNKKILAPILNESILIESSYNKPVQKAINNEEDDGDSDILNSLENSAFEKPQKIYQTNESENSNEKNNKEKEIKKISSYKVEKVKLAKTCNINQEIKDLVYKEEKLHSNQIKIVDITKDGNCFYRCLSYFLLRSQEYYKNIKNLIIDWIENNYKDFLEFFGDDDAKNLKKEEIAKNELDYIKSNDSWGSHYTISIACLIFKIDIAVYTYEGN